MSKPTGKPTKKMGRNDPCHCGSGLKLKKCHGDFVKIEIAGRAYQEKFNELIEAEKVKAEGTAGVAFWEKDEKPVETE